MLFPVSRSFIQYFSHSFADVSTFLCSKYLSICANCIALLCIWLLHYNTKHIPIRTEMKMSVNESEWKKKYQHTKTKQQQQQQWISTDVSISCWMNEIGIGHKGRTTMLLMLCFGCCVYLCIFCVFDHFHFSCSSILWLRRCSRFRRLFLCVLYAPTIDIANSIDFAHGISAHTPNTHTHIRLSHSPFSLCVWGDICNDWPFISLEIEATATFCSVSSLCSLCRYLTTLHPAFFPEDRQTFRISTHKYTHTSIE